METDTIALTILQVDPEVRRQANQQLLDAAKQHDLKLLKQYGRLLAASCSVNAQVKKSPQVSSG